jgi:hypothetical protein
MGSLGLHADPDGWLNAGYSIRTLMESLDSELYDADRVGGAGLSEHWAGPVAEAFSGNWSGLRSRAEDLIAQGRRAASAITDFGGRLEDFVRRAADLEDYWLSFGLQLGLDGMHFALPWGFEQLSAAHQVSFHQWLTESERDVTVLWSDIRAAVDDVVTALESLIAAFEDFAVLELGAAAGALRWVWNAEVSDPLGRLDDGVSLLAGHLDRASTRALDHAYQVVVAVGDDASHDMQAAADAATRSAIRDAKVARVFGEVDKWGGRAVAVVAVGVTAWETYGTAKKQGWVNAIEDHAGDWANLGAGSAAAWGAGLALAAIGAPVAVAAVGVLVVGTIVGVGVGDLVQSYVKHHHAQVGHAITDVGHGAGVTAKAVGHGVEDVAGWEAEHTKGLAKFV